MLRAEQVVQHHEMSKKAKRQEKVFIICINKFLSALVAGSFQVSADLSWMCEVSSGTSSYIYSGESKKIPRCFVLAGQAESQ